MLQIPPFYIENDAFNREIENLFLSASAGIAYQYTSFEVGHNAAHKAPYRPQKPERILFDIQVIRHNELEILSLIGKRLSWITIQANTHTIGVMTKNFKAREMLVLVNSLINPQTSTGLQALIKLALQGEEIWNSWFKRRCTS